MKLNKNLVFFTGGGTGGHIYRGQIIKILKFTGLAVQREWTKILSKKQLVLTVILQ